MKMKLKLTFLVCFIGIKLMAQNVVSIDVNNEALSTPVVILNLTQPINVVLKNYGSDKHVTVNFLFPPHLIPQQNILTSETLLLSQTINNIEQERLADFEMDFTLNESGKHFKIKVANDGTYSYEKDQPVLPADAINNDALFNNSHISELDYVKRKYKNLIIYNPCDNLYEIYRNGKRKNALWYHQGPYAGQGGVIFLIDDFNTAKYTVTTTSSFVDFTSSIPDVFSSVAGLISTGTASSTETDFKLDEVIKVNRSLKALLNHDCGNFYTAQQSLKNYLDKNFTGGIQQLYSAARANYMTQIDVNTKKTFVNKGIDSALIHDFHLNITPDSLIKETLNLINIVQTSSFSYQYNVVQLQNTDQLQFIINITPNSSQVNTSTKAGSLNIVNSTLNIPVLGGWRFDFSTGFYYSNKKNQNYALRPNQAGDTTKSTIVQENNFGGGTIGVNALLHFYYRFSDGITPAVNFGLGKSLDLNYSLLLGGGALINVAGQNRVGISYGLTYTSIKTLSNSQQNTDGSFIQQPSSVTSIAYANRFVWGRFFSLTYTFGLSKSSQSASPSGSNTGNSTSASTSSPGSNTSAVATSTTGAPGGGKKSKSQ